jgi:hypothetical protein
VSPEPRSRCPICYSACHKLLVFGNTLSHVAKSTLEAQPRLPLRLSLTWLRVCPPKYAFSPVLSVGGGGGGQPPLPRCGQGRRAPAGVGSGERISGSSTARSAGSPPAESSRSPAGRKLRACELRPRAPSGAGANKAQWRASEWLDRFEDPAAPYPAPRLPPRRPSHGAAGAATAYPVRPRGMRPLKVRVPRLEGSRGHASSGPGPFQGQAHRQGAVAGKRVAWPPRGPRLITSGTSSRGSSRRSGSAAGPPAGLPPEPQAPAE